MTSFMNGPYLILQHHIKNWWCCPQCPATRPNSKLISQTVMKQKVKYQFLLSLVCLFFHKFFSIWYLSIFISFRNSRRFSFQNTDGSPYVDIPMQCIDYDHYRASLAHKANHSFNPNCKFIAVGMQVFWKFYDPSGGKSHVWSWVLCGALGQESPQ